MAAKENEGGKVSPPLVTGENTHRATAKGFAGRIVDEGEFVPAGIPIGKWMAEI